MGCVWKSSSAILFSLIFTGCFSSILFESDPSSVTQSPQGESSTVIPDIPEGTSFFVELEPDLDIGEFWLQQPSELSDKFVLHGTLPLPKGVYPGPVADEHVFFVDDQPAQVEIVSRYPTEIESADVVELLAYVDHKPAEDGMSRYKVRVGKVKSPTLPATATVQEMLLKTANLPNAVGELLVTTESLKLVGYDYQGVRHSANLLSGYRKNIRFGPVMNTQQTYSTMLPENSGGQYSHLFGVHAFVSTLTEASVILIDLAINNGPTGQENIQPLGIAYIQSLGIEVPQGWTLINQIDDPFFRSCKKPGQTSVYPCSNNFTPIVDAINNLNYNDNAFFTSSEGDLHVFGPQSVLVRRLALVPDDPSFIAAGQRLLAQEGLAFSKLGTNKKGDAYYTWSNPQTARYFPHNQLLADLSFLDLNGVRDQHDGRFEALKAARESGSADINSNVIVGNQGPWHPFDNSGGGNTSGLGIDMVLGASVAASGSQQGVRYLHLLFSMITDRQPDAFFQPNGEPFEPSDFHYVDSTTGLVQQKYKHFWMGPWSPQYINPAYPVATASTSTSEDPFGYTAALLNSAEVGSKQPGYQRTMLGDPEVFNTSYEAYDPAHYIRYTRVSKALTWLSNDALSKLMLRNAGALAIGTLHATPFNKSNLGEESSVAMVTRLNQVAQLYAFPDPAAKLAKLQQGAKISNPAQLGFSFGRAEAWTVDTAVAAYAIASPQWRQKQKKWYGLVARMVKAGQSICSGLVLAKTINKLTAELVDLSTFLNLQIFEESLTHLAYHGLRTTVFDDNEIFYPMMGEVIDTGARGLFTSAWNGATLWWNIGVTSLFPDAEYHYYEAFGQSPVAPGKCDGVHVAPGENPPNHTGQTEGLNSMSIPAYAFSVNPDNFFMQRSAQQNGLDASGDIATLAEKIRQKFENNDSHFTVKQVEKFEFNAKIGLLAIAQQHSGKLP